MNAAGDEPRHPRQAARYLTLEGIVRDVEVEEAVELAEPWRDRAGELVPRQVEHSQLPKSGDPRRYRATQLAVGDDQHLYAGESGDAGVVRWHLLAAVEVLGEHQARQVGENLQCPERRRDVGEAVAGERDERQRGEGGEGGRYLAGELVPAEVERRHAPARRKARRDGAGEEVDAEVEVHQVLDRAEV
uniref:Uncharacterized protein n=1 Tax=Arundo donax TaxID=35708 RepID=A0A0A9CIA0_ARUDO